jgi:hypothetical protein
MPTENTTQATAPSAPLPDDATPTPGESITDRLTGQDVEPTPAPEPPPDEPGEPVEPPGPGDSSTMVAPAKEADGWQVDPYQLRSFTDAVVRVRSYLDAVQAKVNRMQGVELTPQIGTSPVGEQLAKKFDDRLNSADGLRARLTEAMKHMDDFVTKAEAAARAYEEAEDSTVDTINTGGQSDTQAKRG